MKTGTAEHLLANSFYEAGPLDTPCRVWNKARTRAGYGVVSTTPLQYAHRLAYKLFVSDPTGFHVLHKCDNPSCNNEEHLFLGDDLANVRDMHAKGRARKFRKLSEEQVLMIKQDHRNYKELAVDYRVSDSMIIAIRNGKRRKNG